MLYRIYKLKSNTRKFVKLSNFMDFLEKQKFLQILGNLSHVYRRLHAHECFCIFFMNYDFSNYSEIFL